MTAIVGIVDKDKVWMGADRLGVNGYLMTWNKATDKVFKTGPFVIGCCGYPRVSQLVKYKLGLKDDPRKEAHEFMCVDFVDKMRTVLNDNGAKIIDKNEDSVSVGSWLLISFRGQLYEVQPNFQVEQRTEPYDAIGCGAELALGSLHESSRSKLKPKERIIRALKCAENFSAGVRGPFKVISTK